MREKRHHVLLTDDDRAFLYRLVSSGTAPTRQLTHARILLKSDEGPDGPAWTDAAIVAALDIDRSTVARVRRLFVLEGRDAAVRHRPPRATKPRTLTDADEAHLIALACSAQAVAEAVLVHPAQAACRLRRLHGGRARRLHPPV